MIPDIRPHPLMEESLTVSDVKATPYLCGGLPAQLLPPSRIPQQRFNGVG
jgi:hypothetical protein